MQEAAGLRSQLEAERAARSKERMFLQQRILILQEVLRANLGPSPSPASARREVVDAVAAYDSVQRAKAAMKTWIARARG
jgi:hypothetical protein